MLWYENNCQYYSSVPQVLLRTLWYVQGCGFVEQPNWPYVQFPSSAEGRFNIPRPSENRGEEQLSEILIWIQTFPLAKMHLKVLWGNLTKPLVIQTCSSVVRSIIMDGCNRWAYLSMLGLKLIHVSRRPPGLKWTLSIRQKGVHYLRYSHPWSWIRYWNAYVDYGDHPGPLFTKRISWRLEAVRFGFKLFQSLGNLICSSAATVPRCLSNFRAIQSWLHTISRLRDFAGSSGKSSYRTVNRGPGWIPHIKKYPGGICVKSNMIETTKREPSAEFLQCMLLGVLRRLFEIMGIYYSCINYASSWM